MSHYSGEMTTSYDNESSICESEDFISVMFQVLVYSPYGFENDGIIWVMSLALELGPHQKDTV